MANDNDALLSGLCQNGLHGLGGVGDHHESVNPLSDEILNNSHLFCSVGGGSAGDIGVVAGIGIELVNTHLHALVPSNAGNLYDYGNGIGVIVFFTIGSVGVIRGGGGTAGHQRKRHDQAQDQCNCSFHLCSPHNFFIRFCWLKFVFFRML